IGEPDERGNRLVVCTLNGRSRQLVVRDHSVTALAASVEKADPDNANHISAPYQGTVTVNVASGDRVDAGQVVATIEAMKIEASITAPISGTVARAVVNGTVLVEAGDLLFVLT